MSDKNRFPYGDPRFKIPDAAGQIVNPYDFDSRLLQDLQQRGIEPVWVKTINLGTAGEELINVQGYHFVQYGHDGSSTKAADTSTLLNVSINSQMGVANPYPAKSSRGFSGPFGCLHIQWPAQKNSGLDRYCDLIIFKSVWAPWINGEVCT